VVDFFEEPLPKGHHPRELDFLQAVGRVAFVLSRRPILVVISEDGATAIGVAVVEGLAVAARVLRIIGLDDFPLDDPIVNAVLHVLDDLHHLCHMVRTPSP
jgi:hypothetical protein